MGIQMRLKGDAKMTKFEKWLNTFIEEKGIETELSIQFDDENGNFNIMPVKIILDAIKSTTKEEQAQIKNTIVQIDFKNGNVLDYFKHLAKALV